MKKLRFSDADIKEIISEQGQDKTVAQICEERGISEATFYNWKQKMAHGTQRVTSDRLRTLEKENITLRNFCMDILLKTGKLDAIVTS